MLSFRRQSIAILSAMTIISLLGMSADAAYFNYPGFGPSSNGTTYPGFSEFFIDGVVFRAPAQTETGFDFPLETFNVDSDDQMNFPGFSSLTFGMENPSGIGAISMSGGGAYVLEGEASLRLTFLINVEIQEIDGVPTQNVDPVKFNLSPFANEFVYFSQLAGPEAAGDWNLAATVAIDAGLVPGIRATRIAVTLETYCDMVVGAGGRTRSTADDLRFDAVIVPEPTTFALCIFGALTAVASRRRNK